MIYRAVIKSSHGPSVFCGAMGKRTGFVKKHNITSLCIDSAIFLIVAHNQLCPSKEVLVPHLTEFSHFVQGGRGIRYNIIASLD